MSQLADARAARQPAALAAARRGRTAMLVLLAANAGLTALYVADLHVVASTAAFVLVGLSSLVALGIGPVLHRPAGVRPWRLLALASAAFLVGSVLRPVVAAEPAPLALLADGFTVPGYLLTIAAFTAILRARRNVDRHAVVDGVTVSLGAAVAAVVLFALPAASIEGRPAAVSILAGIYPFFDVLLLLLVLALGFTTAVATRSFAFLAGAMVALFVGDVGYAVLGTSGILVGPKLLDAVYAVGYTSLGLAALHPSMSALAAVHPRAVQAWSWQRLLLLVPALAVPAVLPLLRPATTGTLRTVYAVTVLAVIAALLTRASLAINGSARVQRSLQHQATHDALTGLANRSQLLARVDSALAAETDETDETDEPASVCLLFMDLDGFKLVNDSWGHSTGDELLVEVAERLRANVTDALVISRIGGDEFVIATGPHRGGGGHLDRLALQVSRVFATPFQLADAHLAVTPSIGIVDSTAGASSAERMVRDADTAMYRSKAAGRNHCTRFDESMHAQVRGRVETELALRHAIARGQLSLEYQPIVDLATGAVLSAEALVRWDHPRLGRISPVDFIPVAEESGLIVDIGAWVLSTALEQAAAWRFAQIAPPSFTISVNVSTRQLLDASFTDFVSTELTRCGLPASTLTIEVTESAMLDDEGVAARALRTLQRRGVRIAVDDFGTGYSALAHLRRLPLDVVKIDRSFIDGLGHNGDDEEIVRAIVGMAHALRLKVVAEGVETEAQRQALLAVGADRGQGWLFGRPTAVPALSPVESAAPALAGTRTPSTPARRVAAG
ncbi:MAG: bifunctional diguanylate cyclase/phosphodiesterase [Actinomycetota bacterium]|nr:bifunctional diguanylate cyclase/phosphodiesterase [Actinomycetota bacterium]